jgi:3-phenylpropionate/trans-cinnamate dioxygenase ferredoxin reductase subunit
MEKTARTFIVVGGGHAGGQAIDSLRREGFDGRLVLVADEPHLPYQRPPLSKKYLAGDMKQDQLFLRPQSFFEQQRVELRLGRRATAIDRGARLLRLDDGAALAYDKLLLCLGARPRPLDLPGSALAGIFSLRTLADADRIRDALAQSRRLVVVGAGYIGLEIAATARAKGLSVTVLEATDRPMSRVVGPVISDFFARKHEAAGVTLRFSTSATGFLGDARVEAVTCSSGEPVPADMVVVGVGILPEIDLAAAAGLACNDGIVVDEHASTSDPDIFAAGDCTNHPSVRYGGRMRLESVDNALEQARTAAANMCGRAARHEHVPWFWSDQYDTKLQIAGLSAGHDQTVVRGDPATNQLSVWYLREGELLAAEVVNRAPEFVQARKWLAERKRPDPAKLADAGVDLKTL